MPISPELRERIRGWLHAYLMQPNLEAELRSVAAFGALPLYQDVSGCLALRPDGSVVSVQWQNPEASFREVEPAFRIAALVSGRPLYPELSELLPTRAPGTPDCGNCEGRGELAEGGVCGVCHGLGFVTAPAPASGS